MTYSVTITALLMCSPLCSSTVIGCTYDIHSGIYNMCVYDIEEEDTLSDDWAILSTNITITGLKPTHISIETLLILCLINKLHYYNYNKYYYCYIQVSSGCVSPNNCMHPIYYQWIYLM